MSIKAGMTNNKGRSFDGNSDNIVNTIQTKDDISQLSDYSVKLERILLALVRQQEDLKQQFDYERKYREEKEKEFLEKVGTEAKVLEDLIKKEKDSRLASAEKLKEEIDKNSHTRNKEGEQKSVWQNPTMKKEVSRSHASCSVIYLQLARKCPHFSCITVAIEKW